MYMYHLIYIQCIPKQILIFITVKFNALELMYWLHQMLTEKLAQAVLRKNVCLPQTTMIIKTKIQHL